MPLPAFHAASEASHNQSSQDELRLRLAFTADMIRLLDEFATFTAVLRGEEHVVEFVNATYAELMGDQKIIGLTIDKALPDAAEQGFVSILNDVFRSGRVINAKSIFYERVINGVTTNLYVDMLCRPILEESGAVTGILIQGTDVTDRVLAELDPRRGKNRLTREGASPGDFTHELSDRVDTSFAETAAVKLETAPFSPFALFKDEVDALAMKARESQITLTLDLEDAEHVSLIGDVKRLKQIIRQFCQHAMSACEGGSMHLAALCVADGDRPVRLAITVTVTGTGAPSEKIVTLFPQTLNFRTELPRVCDDVAIGVSALKTLADMMDADLNVSDIPGEGCIFSLGLSVPIATLEEDEVQRLLPASPSTLPILLVEDYEPNILVATTMLEQLGYKVDVAVNGIIAVEKARIGNYAFALMDVRMPGMSGLEATRMIREDEASAVGKRMPIIGVTAQSLAVDRERCLAAGMDDFLAKPFRVEELENKLMAQVDMKYSNPVTYLRASGG
jgi:CheY-like chemotaxis protein/signal transduction histidine kinase